MGRWILAASLAAFAAVARGAIPLEHFAREPSMGSPSLSPEGKRFVYISGDHEKPVVVLYDFEKRAAHGLMVGEAERMRVRWCGFKTEDRVLCSFGGSVREMGSRYSVSRLVAINVDGSGMKVLMQNDKNMSAQFQDQIMHWLPDDPEHVLVELDDNGNVFPGVFRLNVHSGKLRNVQLEREPITDWVADRRGVVRFGYGEKGDSALYLARDGEDSPWRTLAKFKLFKQDFSLLGFAVDPNVLLISALHNGRWAVWELDLADEKDRHLVFAHPEVDVERAIKWGVDGRIAGFHFETDRPQDHFIDPEVKALRAAIDARFPDTRNYVLDVSRNGQKVLISSYSDVRPSRYRLLDLPGKTVVELGQAIPELASVALAPMKTVTVPGPDGIRIPGYLTLPQGEPKNLPAVVLPHGGPHARDSWGYDSLVQVLASRGYAVLQLNFRGSTGYGSAWFDAGWQNWGTVMHDDITAGARWLIAEGIADAKRLCIVGWSYGGFAALVGAMKEPDLYRCAVSIAGVTDIADLQWDWFGFYGGRAGWQAITGTDREQMDAISPRRNAERIKIPVLLVHGELDNIVPPDHSTHMAKALARVRVPHELMLVDDGDHGLTRGAWRLALYKKLEAFLAANLGAVP